MLNAYHVLLLILNDIISDLFLISECGLSEIDLIIIVDSSTSVGQDNYDKMLQFCKDFLGNADLDSGSVRVGVLIYSSGVEIQFNLNTHSSSADIFEAIGNIPYIYGSTNTADAIKTMRNMFNAADGDRDGVPNVGIVITDGISNINSRRTISEADGARADGIHVYSIGIGLTDTTEVDAIANQPPADNSFNVQSFEELHGLDKKIFSSFCPGKCLRFYAYQLYIFYELDALIIIFTVKLFILY